MIPIVSITELGKMYLVLAGVAAMMNDLSHTVYYAANPLPEYQEQELVSKYGKWAVSLAKASCPFGDVECIEREAALLSKARLSR